jgi:hypothetical protein
VETPQPSSCVLVLLLLLLLLCTQDGHTAVSWRQLSHWEDCPKWDDFQASSYTAGSTTVSFETPCDYFTTGALPGDTHLRVHATVDGPVSSLLWLGC